jgi:hypothetical protein
MVLAMLVQERGCLLEFFFPISVHRRQSQLARGAVLCECVIATVAQAIMGYTGITLFENVE